MKELTVEDFIKQLQNLRPSLQKSPIKIECPNGLLVEPKIKMWVENYDFSNLKGIIIQY